MCFWTFWSHIAVKNFYNIATVVIMSAGLFSTNIKMSPNSTLVCDNVPNRVLSLVKKKLRN